MYRRLKDFTAAIEDLVQAVELSEQREEAKERVKGQAEARAGKDELDSVEEEARFQLVLTYNDFAVQCFSRGLYAEATLLLNKAIDNEKSQAGLYLNRGGEATDTSLWGSRSGEIHIRVTCGYFLGKDFFPFHPSSTAHTGLDNHQHLKKRKSKTCAFSLLH